MVARLPRRPVAETLSGPKATRTRAVLVQAAKDLFMRKGYMETSVDDIADAADVSRPTFYTYFRSKREVMEAIGVDASDAAEPVFDALGRLGPGWTVDDLAAWVRSYFAYRREHLAWTLVWVEAMTLERPIKDANQAVRRHHARNIGKHLQGLGAPANSDPLYDGLIVLALLETLSAEALRSGGSDQAPVDAAAKAIQALIRRT
jgi:AcrR family transcriptional regulator